MARLSVGKKKDSENQSRKDLLKREDAFTTAAEGSVEWATANKKPLVIGAVVLFVAIVVGVIVDSVMDAKAESSAQTFAKATKIMAAKVLPPESTETANPSADPPVFASDKERDLAARDAFRAASQDAHGKSALLSRFMVADLTAKVGEKEAAEKELSGLLADVAADDSLRFLVVERLAFLQEGRGDMAAALRTLDSLKGDAFYADRASLQAARIEVAMGDTAKARTRLEKLKADHPNKPIGTEAGDMLTAMGVTAPPADAKDVPSPASADLTKSTPTTKAD